MTDINTGIHHEPNSPVKYQLLINGKWTDGAGDEIIVLDKFHQTPFAVAAGADHAQLQQMIEAAEAAYRRGAPNAYERGAILDRASSLLEERSEEFVKVMQAEAGFTRSDATGELRRAIQTLRLSGEETRRLSGDVLPFSGVPQQAGRFAFTLRVPLGIIAAITPFNSPVNTVLHKIAPAFGAGNAVILKPSSTTPVTACKLGELLIDAGIPAGFLSILHGNREVVNELLADQRVRFFAFTGSTEVGKTIQHSAGLRRTQMELGSIAFTILCDDANLDNALPKVINAGYRKAGQVCTSIQILLVQRDIMDEVRTRLTEKVGTLKFGNPHTDDMFVGPLISEKDAIRVENWIEEAISMGADRLVGGPRQGTVIPPTLLEGISDDMRVGCSEVFGPVVCLAPFDTLDEAIDRVNSSPYGLASGIFTNRLLDALTTAQRLEVGGVHINETCSSRVDLMPYGGSKDSGFGREGPRYAIHEMTEERVVSIATQ